MITNNKRRPVGTVKITLDFELWRNDKEMSYELCSEYGHVELAGHGLNSVRDQIVEQLIEAGAPESCFRVEIFRRQLGGKPNYADGSQEDHGSFDKES